MDKLQGVLDALNQNRSSEPFRVPVDWKAWNLPDYPKIVKYPMDLSTVQAKLNAGRYSDVAAFAKDVERIWDNCRLYNPPETEYYVLADRCEKFFLKEMTKATGQVPAVLATEEEKDAFCKKVYALDAVRLGPVVELVHRLSPAAMRKVDDDEAHIDVNAIGALTIEHVFALLDNPDAKAEDVIVK